jgi:hypothetical protein
VSTQIQKQLERLLTSFRKAEIEEIETQHQDPVLVHQKEQTLNACLDKCTSCSTFDDGWHWLGEKFTLLRRLAGGLATMFPSTAAVGSYFSLIKWEKNEFRSALTDLSLEGILHSKQYKAVLKHKTE